MCVYRQGVRVLLLLCAHARWNGWSELVSYLNPRFITSNVCT